MEKNEIKKFLYKSGVNANLEYIKNGTAHYYYVSQKATVTSEAEIIRFEVPVSDMGEARFETIMPGKLLIRWIVD